MTGVGNNGCPFIISPRGHDERTQGHRQPPPAKPAGDPPVDEEDRDGGDGRPEVEQLVPPGRAVDDRRCGRGIVGLEGGGEPSGALPPGRTSGHPPWPSHALNSVAITAPPGDSQGRIPGRPDPIRPCPPGRVVGRTRRRAACRRRQIRPTRITDVRDRLHRSRGRCACAPRARGRRRPERGPAGDRSRSRLAVRINPIWRRKCRQEAQASRCPQRARRSRRESGSSISREASSEAASHRRVRTCRRPLDRLMSASRAASASRRTIDVRGTRAAAAGPGAAGRGCCPR